MNYIQITRIIEQHITCLLSDPVYDKKKRHEFAYGAYLTWHALVGNAFLPEDDLRLWKLVRYR